MTIKMNRESILVILSALMLLVGIFYYGNIYLLEDLKQEADLVTQTVGAQEALIANYPPSEEALDEYKEEAAASEDYLPIGDQTNTALVTLENLANSSSVTIRSINRNSFQESIANVPGEFVKNKYTAEFQTTAPANIRRLIEQLENQERVWNITNLTYTKAGDNVYTGNFEFELYYFSRYNQTEEITNVEEEQEVSE